MLFYRLHKTNDWGGVRMRRTLVLIALGFAMGLCGCGPGGTALLLLLLSQKDEKQSKETGLRPPAKAHSPRPTNNATDVPVTTNLSWGAADGALSYNVYLGTDATAVSNATTSDPEFVGNQTQLSYDPPGNLKYDTTYFWRVDSVNAAGVTKGDVWCFTTESPPSLLRIITTGLPDATEGVPYSAMIEAAGGTTPYTWSVSGLPPGLTWVGFGDAVEITGTPDVGTAGTYSVDVTVSDSSSPTQSAHTTLQLVVNSGGVTTLKADFEATPTYGKAPLTVNFTDKSTGNPISWEWDFDNDGIVDSVDQNPTYTYYNPGWYTVKLTVSDGIDTDTCVKEMYVLVANGIYYVDGVNGNDANGGTGWSDAFATIGKALSVAGDYDLVLVADSTYNERDLDYSGKAIYLKGVNHNTPSDPNARPVIDCQQLGRAFWFHSGETEDSVIDNFVIQNGRAEDTYGGAVVCENYSSPTIMNCMLQGNEAVDTDGLWDDEHGGAIYCTNSSSPVISDCTFSGNNASKYGGGICCDSGDPKIANCTFSGNSAGAGGAIHCRSSSPSITDCRFIGNDVTGSGGAILCWTSSSPKITNCIFSGNNADYGGAISCAYSSSLYLTNCTFSGNSATAGVGGAVSCWSGSLTVINCTFSHNSTPYWGGAIWCCSSSLTLTNCAFSVNSASGYGGAIYCENSSSSSLNNCILWDNSAGTEGDEIYIYDSGSSCTLNYCCVDSTGYGGYTSNITENNCIYSDPEFVCPEAGVLRLRHTSPCIDAGDDSLVPSDLQTDILGCPRIVGSAVDIGAYEHQGVIYVDPVNGSDSNDGLSWATAKRSIQPAIDAASDGWVILLADGTYNGYLNRNLDTQGKALHIVSKSGDPGLCVIDCEHDGRAFHIHSGEPSELIIEGVTIRKGRVEDAPGGAMVCKNHSSPTIINCVFQGNEAVDANGTTDEEDGGAICCEDGGDLSIIKCVFSGNSADRYGGAVYCVNFSSPVVSECKFSDNKARAGGAIGCCQNSSPTVSDCVFVGNGAKGSGGAIYCWEFSDTSVDNCVFSNNSADYGGAIYCYASALKVMCCLFVSNSADAHGGAIRFHSSRGSLITNCTFSGNVADWGGAICCNFTSRATLNNCILWGDSATNSGDEIYISDPSSSCTLNYCCVDNAGYGFGSGVPTTRIDDSNNCIFADPQFVDPANGDYHLKDTSPCIDAGDNSLVPSGVDKDLDGNERIVDGNNDGTPTVDIGAYEYQP